MERDDWYTAYVVGSYGQMLFVVPLPLGFSCTLPEYVLKGRKLKFGDFLRIKMKENRMARPGNTARHVVTEFEQIDTPKCIEDVIVRDKLVLIQVTARIYTKSEYKKKPIQLLEHELFGTIIDLDNIIPESEIGTNFSIQFKCTKSPLDQNASIFVVCNRSIRRDSTVEDSPSSKLTDSRPNTSMESQVSYENRSQQVKSPDIGVLGYPKREGPTPEPIENIQPTEPPPNDPKRLAYLVNEMLLDKNVVDEINKVHPDLFYYLRLRAHERAQQ